MMEIQTALLKWYATHHRDLPWRRDSNPYGIWVSEVMLQQTQVKTVVPYYGRFMEAFPTVAALARADLEQVLKLWEGLGYYARARNLHKACQTVAADLKGVIPRDPGGFKALPGVGAYIAAAVLSIAFDLPLAVVDGNVKRVLARVFTMDDPVNHSPSHKNFQAKADRLLDRSCPGTFNQAVMELGALVCSPRNPGCTTCPLGQHCQALEAGRVDHFPHRNTTKPVPTVHIAAGVVKKQDKLLITLRKPEGLLGGLWEFPGGKVQAGEDAPSACVRELAEETGLRVGVTSHLARIKHAYTHFKIEMDVFICQYISGRVRLNGPVDHRWIFPGEIRQYPFPKANLKFIPLLEERDPRP
jgi:A/G-specific adenine glycosylase